MLSRGIPRSGYTVTKQQQDIGRISSGSFSPTLNTGIALAFLTPGKAVAGSKRNHSPERISGAHHQTTILQEAENMNWDIPQTYYTRKHEWVRQSQEYCV